MRRATGILLPGLVLVLAACAAPDTGGQASNGASQPASSAAAAQSAGGASSAPETAETGGAERVDISTLAEDPGAYAGSEIRILARVDEAVTENESFYTSPSGAEEGRLLVVLGEDAQVDKEIMAGVNVWVTGTIVAADAEGLDGAGAVSSEIPEGYAGEWALVASEIGDPLASSDTGDDDADASASPEASADE